MLTTMNNAACSAKFWINDIFYSNIISPDYFCTTKIIFQHFLKRFHIKVKNNYSQFPFWMVDTLLHSLKLLLNLKGYYGVLYV
jgi:hypothetical protein